jgi:CBS domain-containing protein
MFKVKDIMSSPVISVPENTRLIDAVKIMVEKGIGSVIVETPDGLRHPERNGIITERDVTRVIADNRNVEGLTVSECMSSPLFTVDVDSTLVEASEKMLKYNFRRMPVVYDGKLVGMVTSKDVTRALRYFRAKCLTGHASDGKP